MIECNVQVMELSLQAKSMEQVPMEISDDDKEEALMKLNEDELQQLQKVGTLLPCERRAVIWRVVSNEKPIIVNNISNFRNYF